MTETLQALLRWNLDNPTLQVVILDKTIVHCCIFFIKYPFCVLATSRKTDLSQSAIWNDLFLNKNIQNVYVGDDRMVYHYYDINIYNLL